MTIAQEFHLKVILNNVTHTQDILDKIASYHVPVIIGPIYEAPRANERSDAAYSLPAQLARRGVTIAIVAGDGGPGGGANGRNLPYAAGYAVAYGLPYDDAIRAITLNPAAMFGMGDQLGSLDVGKTANVVLADGDPLDVRTVVKQVFIGGNMIPMVSRQTQLRDEYLAPRERKHQTLIYRHPTITCLGSGALQNLGRSYLLRRIGAISDLSHVQQIGKCVFNLVSGKSWRELSHKDTSAFCFSLQAN